MSEDTKKNQEKKKNDPKEQRKPRNARNQASKVKKKAEKVDESRSVTKVPQKPPVYQDPGPEFYKSLKRETEEIIKITEEENSKYKKKEIQSNWSKYEMPIESYEEIEEDNIGADYEKLIQAPLSIGGHFQFKHEKSWDVSTGPSLHDKYFEINMDNLSLAVSAVPFYKRNGIDQTLFSENDILSMNNRATKYKQKYFADKSYSTPETEAHDKILNSLKDSLSKNQVQNVNLNINSIRKIEEETTNVSKDKTAMRDDIDLDFRNLAKTEEIPSPVHSCKDIKDNVINTKFKVSDESKKRDDIDDLLLEEVKPKLDLQILEPIKNVIEPPINLAKTEDNNNKPAELLTQSSESKAKDNPVETKKNPVIESSEDLEKWLDDFLDG